MTVKDATVAAIVTVTLKMNLNFRGGNDLPVPYQDFSVSWMKITTENAPAVDFTRPCCYKLIACFP
jgi:hypothetical protein